MWKYGKVFLRQKFSNKKRSVSRRVVAVQHPVVCNVRSDSLDPFSKSFQDIFVVGVINCLSWRYKSFVQNATAVGKNNNDHSLHPGSAHSCFLMKRMSRVPFRALPSGFGIVLVTPTIHLLLLLYPKKFWVNSESSQQILTNFQPARFFFSSTDKFPALVLY